MEFERCKNNNGTEQLHSCPYSRDINDDDSECCNCCSECEYQCCMDI